MTLHEDYISAYGFGLPVPVPTYRPVKLGNWTLTSRLGHISNGYAATHAIENRYDILERDGVTWMSTVQMELESHAWHLEQATGTVVVAGLGMGVYLHAIAAKPDVTKIIVAELDPQVIAILKASANPEQWPGWEKVTILNMDVFSADFATAVENMTGQIDYLYIDIWETFPDPRAPDQTRYLSDRLKPVSAGWWGQELEIALWANDSGLPLTAETIQSYCSNTGIPAKITEGYASFCLDVAAANELDHDHAPSPAF